MTALMVDEPEHAEQANGSRRERLAIDTEPLINLALELRVLKANRTGPCAAASGPSTAARASPCPRATL